MTTAAVPDVETSSEFWRISRAYDCGRDGGRRRSIRRAGPRRRRMRVGSNLLVLVGLCRSSSMAQRSRRLLLLPLPIMMMSTRQHPGIPVRLPAVGPGNWPTLNETRSVCGIAVNGMSNRSVFDPTTDGSPARRYGRDAVHLKARMLPDRFQGSCLERRTTRERAAGKTRRVRTGRADGNARVAATLFRLSAAANVADQFCLLLMTGARMEKSGDCRTNRLSAPRLGSRRSLVESVRW